MFISVTLGSVATVYSTYIIIAEDFLINVANCIMSIYHLRFSTTTSTFVNEKDAIKELILSEKVEFAIPLVYCLCFLMAYYGPNDELLGNIQFSSWHYGNVADIGKFVGNMGILYIVDFLSCVISGVLFWTFSKLIYLHYSWKYRRISG